MPCLKNYILTGQARRVPRDGRYRTLPDNGNSDVRHNFDTMELGGTVDASREKLPFLSKPWQ